MGINSSLWWPFYFFYQEQFKPVFPSDWPPIVLQSLCAPLSTLTSNIITNPLDVIRARMQISKDRQSYVEIVNLVWQQERFNLFFKGLTARLTHSMLYSFFIMLGYESVKKMSLKDEYKELY
jgi:solute carrier family 25 protein 44